MTQIEISDEVLARVKSTARLHSGLGGTPEELVTRLLTEELHFLAQLYDARENGYELVCVECGAGIHDDSDMHGLGCSRDPEHEEYLQREAAWAARSAGVKTAERRPDAN